MLSLFEFVRRFCTFKGYIQRSGHLYTVKALMALKLTLQLNIILQSQYEAYGVWGNKLNHVSTTT